MLKKTETWMITLMLGIRLIGFLIQCEVLITLSGPRCQRWAELFSISITNLVMIAMKKYSALFEKLTIMMKL